MNLDYNLAMKGGFLAGITDDTEYVLYQRGLKVGTTTWGYIKQFRDYYGIIEARDVVETWKAENLISHRA